ncbi:TetR/AcrR family transcriptional regulator [Nocardia sp. alder85J]|uniref:TetR/AcrR family transcriptional regulator n=1 Tax=Nocardia sp. alder85J TaxID=2862949 RepID=UPI001CD56B1B|nr:TetR/AcrR family transcriptional regulator [Nocardia sp. alder85J]MCX4094037.1 TetR/AcrR family transcriptional regulator [Nocardia sp. alder85J]
MPPRRRLTPDQRRAELLDIGARLFAELPYEQVQMDHVAARAGISRTLLYRHFPKKSALFAAIYQRAAEALQNQVQLATGLPLADQVVAGLDAHLEYFAANRNTVLAANRALAGDPVVQAIVFGDHAAMREVMLAAVDPSGPDHAVMSAVVTSWLMFVHTLCLEWLERGGLTRDQVRASCLGALTGSIAALRNSQHQA